MTTLSIIIPVYNEYDQIDLTIKKLLQLKKKIKFELIFIDDFSTDNSYQKLNKISKKNKFIKIFKNKKKGLGSAINIGIRKSKSEYLCIFMCDLSDDTNDIIKYFKIIKKDKNLHAVFGTRFSRESIVKNYPTFKLILNRIFNNIVRIVFFSKYNDFTNAFKIYKRKTLISLFPLVSEHFNIFLEIPLKIINRKHKFKIIPIKWTNRKKGYSKFKVNELGSMYMFTLLYCFLEKILLNKRKK